MKIHMNKKLAVCSGVALAFLLTILPSVQALSAEPDEVKDTAQAKMMESCKAMQAQKQSIMEDRKAQDAELTKQVAAMNSAPADKKVDLMAAVVTRIVEERTAMGARMAMMPDDMMQHMMKHMQMSKESMMQCPMMKDMSETSAGTQEGHHDQQK